MDKLISKSIEAIKENKNEYAIGLLEGALEMAGITPVKQNTVLNTPISTPQTVSDEIQIPEVPMGRLEEIKKLAELSM